MSTTGEQTGALAGVRILDLGTRIAAPFAATLLADFGADVIKVEAPRKGDFLRGMGPFVDGYSLWWAVENRGKKSVTLDLRRREGQELFRQLVQHVDVVVENFQPGTLESWNLGFEELRAVNPRLILARISVYGQDGPYSPRPGLDRIAIAFGGLLHITGFPDHPPVRPGILIADYLTGVFSAFAILTALYHRDCRAGAGQWIDLALYEAIFRVMEYTAAAFDRLQQVRERTGNRLPNSAPVDQFLTRDGQYLCVVAGGDELFRRLARAIGQPQLCEDPRFSSVEARVANAGELHDLVAQWVHRHDAEEAERVLLANQVPVSRVYSIADIFADPHFAARGSIVTVEDPVIGPLRMQGVFPRFSNTPGSIRRGAPRLGEHNHEVYCGLLGLDETEFDRLRQAGVI